MSRKSFFATIAALALTVAACSGDATGPNDGATKTANGISTSPSGQHP